ncbi:MAG TPA: hypothetical protein VMA09_23200 [Candidatus Binataceae bacterium]|nr:hypothetical protein [Candidatus Binataceae bacterium]
MKILAPQQRLAPASLKSVAPALRKRCARSRRICTASPSLIGGSAMRRYKSLSSVAVPDLGENGGGEKMAVGFQAQAADTLAFGKRV